MNEKPFWDEIQAFLDEDKKQGIMTGQIVFYGSSTIGIWQQNGVLKKHMAPLNVIGRGFGGSNARDAFEYAPLVLHPYKPKLVVYYEGENDMAQGLTPYESIEYTKQIIKNTKELVPDVKWLILTVKHSPSRVPLRNLMDEVNELYGEIAAVDENCHLFSLNDFIDEYEAEYSKKPFMEDELHFTPHGYDVLAPMVKKVIEDILNL